MAREIAAHGMEAALHVNNASGLTFNHAVREAPPETRSSEGGGVWAEYVPTVALKSTPLLLMTSMCLYRSGLGGRGERPAFPLDRGRFFIWGDSHRVRTVHGCAAQSFKVSLMGTMGYKV